MRPGFRSGDVIIRTAKLDVLASAPPLSSATAALQSDFADAIALTICWVRF